MLMGKLKEEAEEKEDIFFARKAVFFYILTSNAQIFLSKGNLM